MNSMFYSCTHFDQPLNNWNVSSVTTMSNMFRGAPIFNQPLNTWNTSSVTSMSYMFAGTPFNQNLTYDPILNYWNTSNVTTMNNMFRYNSVFNNGQVLTDATHPIGWIVSPNVLPRPPLNFGGALTAGNMPVW